MAKNQRHSTNYPGVYFVESTVPGSQKADRIFYIRYRRGTKLVEEKAGRQSADDMTAARASKLRVQRIEGEALSNQEKREKERAEREAELNKWTIQKLWGEYASHKDPQKAAFRIDQGRYDRFLKESFAEKEPKDILRLDIDRLRVKLLKSKSPQTVKHVLALLRRLIKFGTDRGLCLGLGFAITLPRVDNKKTEFLAADELKNLLRVIDEDTHHQAGNIMKMALYTGMRRGELFKLQWKDVDFENGFITIREPKGGRDQKIPMNGGARQVLEDIHRGRSPYVFAGRSGNQRQDINKALSKIKEKAGLPKDFRPLHGLRHTYASMLASSGKVDLYTLQKLMTHKDHRMTERYAHLSDNILKRAANVAADIFSNIDKEKTINISNKGGE